MKVAVLILAIVACASARTDNRSPKGPVKLDFCEKCKDTVVQLRTILDDPDKFARFQSDLRVVCSALGPYADACVNMVDNLPFVIHQIRPLLNNETEACIRLDLCGQSSTNTGAKKLALLLIRKHLLSSGGVSPRVNDIACEECIFAVTELKSLLQDPSIQGQVKSFLNSVCAKMGSMRDECTQLLDQYLPLVFTEIEALLDNPRAVCTDAGMCSGASSSAEPSRVAMLVMRVLTRMFPRHQGNQQHLPGAEQRLMSVHTDNAAELPALELMLLKSRTKGLFSVGCTICESSVRKLKQFLMNDESGQVEVINTIKKLCNKMPAEITPQCIDFLNIYGRAALIVTIDQMDPKKVCIAMKMCDARESKRLAKLWKSTPQYRGAVECEACHIFVNIVQRELQEASVQAEITQLVKRLCTLGPAAYESEFLPALLANVGRLTPDVVCPAVNMCPQSADTNGVAEI